MTVKSAVTTAASSTPSYSPALHGWAIATLLATFPLIFMGGLVTSHHAGMSVPDWPNSYGYNMFLFPPNQWVGGIIYEHTHRLMGTVVGFCAIGLVLSAWGPARERRGRRTIQLFMVIATTISLLAVLAFMSTDQRLSAIAPHVLIGGLSLLTCSALAFLSRRREPRRGVRWLALGVLGAVIFQGILGGLRVVLVKLNLAIVHACFAQAFFCLAMMAVLVTSRWWIHADATGLQPSPRGRRLVVAAIVCVSIVYAQLIVGAVMRHYDAGLAIPDLPLNYGKLLPPTTDAALRAINQQRIFKLDLPRVTMAQVWIHFAHRMGALAVTAAVLWTAISALRLEAGRIKALGGLLIALLLAQLTLGVLTVVYRKPADIASLHVAVGALVLVTSFTLMLHAVRLYWPARAGGGRPRSVSQTRLMEV